MYLDKKKKKVSTITWIRLIVGAIFLVYFIVFRFESLLVLKAIWSFFLFVVSRRPMILDPKTGHAFFIVFFNIFFSFIPAFLVMAFIAATQTLLPTKTFFENYRTAWHLLLHFFGLHGPALFVKDGKLIESEEDKTSVGPGVIVIDFNSAVVLEERLAVSSSSFLFTKPFERMMIMLKLYEKHESPRAHGAGIAFTRIREGVRGVVDLRKQNRSRGGVKAYTRDGIEISTNVWTLFSVGQEPPIVQVTYIGKPSPETLRVVYTRKIQGGSLRITSLENELEEQDRKEIHDFVQAGLSPGSLTPYADLVNPPQLPNYAEFLKQDSPIKQRVFAAVFTQARGEEEKLLPWEDLPPHVAVDIFRELLSHYNYDQLYKPLEEGGFPISELKKRFRNEVRNTGLLSYRLIFHKSRRPLVLGDYNPASLLVTHSRPFFTNKILRERGISLITCGFSDLKPPETVYMQRLDTWRAQWQQDIAISQANYQLEAQRIRSKARIQAQQELRYNLLSILQSTQYPRETMLLRVFQALETIAIEPKTRQLLPPETIMMMESLSKMATATSNPPPNLPPVTNPPAQNETLT